MRTPYRVLLGIACCVIAVCPVSAQSTSATDSSGIASTELPDSPGTLWAQSQQPEPQQPGQDSSSAQTQTASPQPESQSPAKDEKLQRPVGTAAAEAPKVTGITGAHPAGVAIAPAKQRRVRVIVLKVGAIIGAGAAVGTVIALSASTPSKPPGAH